LSQAALPSIAVVIPAYNAAPRLARAVRSVLGTCYPNLTVHVIDDGSEDETSSVAEQLCREDSRCRLWRHPEGRNLGVSAARNLGIRQSESDWLAFLDSDDEYLTHRFEGFTAMMKQGTLADTDAIYELAEVRSEAGRPDEGNWWNSEGGVTFGVHEALEGEALVSSLFEGACWQAGALMLRRSLLAKTGLFDTTKAIAEDCDLWLRVAMAGRAVAGDLSRPVTVYWRHDANTYNTDPRHRLAMLDAMLDACAFAAHTGRPFLALARGKTRQYAMRAVVALRESGEPALAAKVLAKMAARGRIDFLLSWQALRQTQALAREVFLGRRATPT
jgi:glycosyltransferase involved in cell wall biosynthesis